MSATQDGSTTTTCCLKCQRSLSEEWGVLDPSGLCYECRRTTFPIGMERGGGKCCPATNTRPRAFCGGDGLHNCSPDSDSSDYRDGTSGDRVHTDLIEPL